MRAIVHDRYGPPDVLHLTELEMPTPTENQVLIKVHAAAANPLDWHFMRGSPFLVRLQSGLTKPTDPRLGADLAGVVEAVGRSVTDFQPGDAVFGSVGKGAFAEYVCARASALAPKPDNLSFEQAAAVPVVGFTALQGLRNAGKIQSGEAVLVNGASGGVGTFAVQLAKSYGTEVTGVCSTRNVELVHTLGADHVIDYTKADFTQDGGRYDLIYDAVGNRSVSELKRALRPHGRCVIVGFATMPRLIGHMVLGRLGSKREGKTIGLMGTAQPNPDDLIHIKELLEQGHVVPLIDRQYPLGETAEAIQYLETGRARGKAVITIDHDDET